MLDIDISLVNCASQTINVMNALGMESIVTKLQPEGSRLI
jgi:hypothetical protein